MAVDARTEKPQVDFNNIIVYVNQTGGSYRSMTPVGKDYYYGAIRYNMEADGRCIVFKTKKEWTANINISGIVEAVELKGYQYFILGNDSVIRCTNRAYQGFWNRADRENMDIGDVDDMRNVINLNNPTVSFNHTNESYSLGGGGTNGRKYGYNSFNELSWRYNTSYHKRMIPCKNMTVGYSNNMSLTASYDNAWFGFPADSTDQSTINYQDINQYFGEHYATYSGVNYPVVIPRQIPWKWSGSHYDASYPTWSDLQLAWHNKIVTATDEDICDREHCFDGDPLFLNILVSEDYDACVEYVLNGTIPQDAKLITSDEEGNPIPPEEEESEDDSDENEGKPEDNVDSTEPNELGVDDTPILSHINMYIMSKVQASSFIEWFWQGSYMDDITEVIYNSVTGIYNNLTNCISSIKKMPVARSLWATTTHLTPTTVKVGRYNYIMSDGCDVVSNAPLSATKVGELGITPYYNPNADSFMNHAPYTSYEIYLPFVGIIPLPTERIQSKSIEVYATASAYTGEITYQLYYRYKDKRGLIGIYTGKCAIDVPYSLDVGINLNDMAVSTVSSLISSASPIDIPSNGGVAPSTTSMSASNQLSIYNPKKMHLIIRRKKYSLPSNYGAKVGYKCCKALKPSTIDGRIWIDNPKVKTFNYTSPTKDEIEELYTIMKRGFIHRKDKTIREK